MPPNRFRLALMGRPAICSEFTVLGLGPTILAETGMLVRLARVDDAADIARIYNQGIADRVATFETRPRTADDVREWFDGVHPVVTVEDEGMVVAFAATFLYRPRACYAGIAEASVYVERGFRGRGAGRMALEGLIAAAEKAGFWKLVSRIFVENGASRRLVASAGFREVGIYGKQGRIEGVWGGDRGALDGIGCRANLALRFRPVNMVLDEADLPGGTGLRELHGLGA